MQMLVRTPPRAAVQDIDSLGPPAYDLFNLKHFTEPSRWLIRFETAGHQSPHEPRLHPSLQLLRRPPRSGVNVRYHSIEYVLDQMRRAVTDLGVSAVRFEDDTVGADRGRLLELCAAICRADLHKKLKWEACLRVNEASAEVLAEMKAAGCIQVEYGFESGSTESLRRLGKQTDIELNRRAVELTRRAHLRNYVDIMVGLPGETAADFEATVKFLRWARPEIISAARLCPLPGTPIYRNLDPAVRARLDWTTLSYPDSQLNPVNLTAMPDRQINELYRNRRARRGFLSARAYRGIASRDERKFFHLSFGRAEKQAGHHLLLSRRFQSGLREGVRRTGLFRRVQSRWRL